MNANCAKHIYMPIKLLNHSSDHSLNYVVILDAHISTLNHTHKTMSINTPHMQIFFISAYPLHIICDYIAYCLEQ